ncbi:hypothetical protein Q671_17005 [Halomonas sp. PBN3]|nr:hypothetical protein Q671_17005 [Halomonas sp. PBN3]
MWRQSPATTASSGIMASSTIVAGLVPHVPRVIHRDTA